MGAQIYPFRRLVAAVVLLLANKPSGAAELGFVLPENHETFEWRSNAQRPKPTMKSVVHWVLHEQVIHGSQV
jgi:hypothetical protein